MAVSSPISGSATLPAPVLLRLWLSIGLQSFGGGVATLALIRKAFVESTGLITAEEFTRDWGLVQIAPGINLFALTILIGRRTGGARGIAIALCGLLLPSVAATIALTALYARIAGIAWVRAALRGVVPATVGLGIALGIQMLAPAASAAKREGTAPLVACIAIVFAAAGAERLLPAAVVPILIGGGLIAACEAAWRAKRVKEQGRKRQ